MSLACDGCPTHDSAEEDSLGESEPEVRPNQFNTTLNPPANLQLVRIAFTKFGRRRNPPRDRKTVMKIFRTECHAGYGDDALTDCFRFLRSYSVLALVEGCWRLDLDRFDELFYACDNGYALPYDFVPGIHVGDACRLARRQQNP